MFTLRLRISINSGEDQIGKLESPEIRCDCLANYGKSVRQYQHIDLPQDSKYNKIDMVLKHLADERRHSMSFVYVFFSKTIRWSIRKDDPSSLNLRSRPGWLFVNPLSSKYVYNGFSSVKFKVIVGDRALSETNAMIFFSPVGSNFDRDEFREYVNQLVRNIRHFSKQPELGGIYIDKIYITNSFFGDDIEREALSHLPLEWPFPYQRDGFTYRISKYQLDTAVTWEHVVAADHTESEYKPPVFDAFLLDAIAAFREGDYKRSILYAAMSVEVMAAEKLDEAYISMRQNGDPNGRLRIISMQQKGGVIITKDPVYEYLVDRADFKQRLHELPLYILGRSLLLEKEQLYQEAIKLYRTRNKIAHIGEPPIVQEGIYFYTNKSDAMKAIECAISTFQWFGISNGYKIPSSLTIEAFLILDEEMREKLKKFDTREDLKEDGYEDEVDEYEDEDETE